MVAFYVDLSTSLFKENNYENSLWLSYVLELQGDFLILLFRKRATTIPQLLLITCGKVNLKMDCCFFFTETLYWASQTGK